MVKLLTLLLLPPAGPLLLAVLGLIWRRHRVGSWLLAGGLCSLYLLSVPLLSNPLAAAVQRYPALAPAEIPRADAVVLLAGGLTAAAGEYGGDTPGPLSLLRARYAARLAHRTGLPLLVSGGVRDNAASPSEAELLSALLRDEFGVAEVLTETDSLNTQENAVNSARLLRRDGRRRVLLVTHAVHMPRAVTAFRRQGIEVIPAPTAFFPTRFDGDTAADWLPSAAVLWRSRYLVYELLGSVWYRLRYD